MGVITISVFKKPCFSLVALVLVLFLAFRMPIDAASDQTETAEPQASESKPAEDEGDTTSAVIAFLIAVVTVSSVVMLVRIIDPKNKNKY